MRASSTSAAKNRPRPRGAAQPQPPRRTRQEHSQETAQDYVELIADLIGSTGEARVIDLARRLGVTHVTVGRTIQRLQREGLVTTQPYRSIFLTDSGKKLSEEARSRHEIVVAFLESIGVPAETARSEAEGIEHHVSEATLKIFLRHIGSRRGGAASESRPPAVRKGR